MYGFVPHFTQDCQAVGHCTWQVVFSLQVPDALDLGVVGGVGLLVVPEHEFHHFFSQEPELEQAGVGVVIEIVLPFFAQFGQQGESIV